jgi:hypothetical protein
VVTQNVDVYFSKVRSFAPDVLVITAEAARQTERVIETPVPWPIVVPISRLTPSHLRRS